MKLSVVMTYYNRRRQLLNTLTTISETRAPKDSFEVIIVDDGSDSSQGVSDVTREFDFSTHILSLPKSDKWYSNSCVPFNTGFRAARGEIVLIQNAECLHIGDVISYTLSHLRPVDYMVYSCYSIDKENFELLCSRSEEDGFAQKITSWLLLEQRGARTDFENAWYNHKHYRPVYYHFLSAITRKNLLKLNGFDERYANGIWYDDDEFLERVRRLGLSPYIVHPPESKPFAIHQYHRTLSENKPNVDLEARLQHNRRLFHERTLREERWRAPIGIVR